MTVITTTHPRAQCVDLRATFAGQFRFVWDSAYAAERPELRASEGPWLTVIRGHRSHVFPYGGRRLAAYCAAGRATRDALCAVPGAIVQQGGGDCPEVIVSFDVAEIEAVAAILRLQRPRKPLTPDQRQRLIDAGHTFRFSAAPDGATAAPERPDSTNERETA